MLRRRRFLVFLAILWATAACADQFPTGPVRLVVPYSPGGSSDIMARALGAKLSDLWRQPVIIENRPGGTTTVATQYVARAAPDGYTLLVAPPPFVISPYVYKGLGYDAEKDFVPVSLVAFYPLVLAVPTASAINTLGNLVSYAKANPGQTYPSPGAGTTPHLIGELMARQEKLEMLHVPYKSGAQGVTDLIAGRLTWYAGPTTEIVNFVRAGKLKAIAVLADKRSPILPNVPTSVEAGFGYLKASSWTTIVAPAGTRRDLVAQISADIAKVALDPDFREKLEAQGAEFIGANPAETLAFHQSERMRWGPLVRALGIKPD